MRPRRQGLTSAGGGRLGKSRNLVQAREMPEVETCWGHGLRPLVHSINLCGGVGIAWSGLGRKLAGCIGASLVSYWKNCWVVWDLEGSRTLKALNIWWIGPELSLIRTSTSTGSRPSLQDPPSSKPVSVYIWLSPTGPRRPTCTQSPRLHLPPSHRRWLFSNDPCA